jgi:hypothetical protein
MSSWISAASTARARLPRIADQAVERARLTVVPRRSHAPRVPFVILVSVVLLGGVVGLLLFNTSMQQDSFKATALETQAAQLHAQEQSLQMELDRLRDPQEVAQRAERLGMVPILNPAFIRLSDGRILGNPIPATAADAQRITPLPTRPPMSFHRAPVKVVVTGKHQGTQHGNHGAPSGPAGTDTGTTVGQR